MSEGVLLFTERSNWGKLAATALRSTGAAVTHMEWSFGEPRIGIDSETLRLWTGDYVVAFKADIRVPPFLLERARAAVNFHPGPPWYRGVACPERAIANRDDVYGVTLHLMTEEFDSGEILDVRSFPVHPSLDATGLRVRIGAEVLCQLMASWPHREAWPAFARHEARIAPIWSGGLYSLGDARAAGLIN